MTDRAGYGSEWVSAHAFYQGDLDLLVTGVVAGLTGELAAGGFAREFFFVRHWDGGPHLRLRILPAPGVPVSEVRGRTGEWFDRYLSRHPSAGRLSAREYTLMAGQLARRENVSFWSPVLSPNNTVSFVTYRREYQRYGHGPTIQAVERHFAESSRIALRVVTRAAPMEQRATLALACILTAWFTGCPDPGRLRIWLTGRPRGDSTAATVELARTARELAGGDRPGSGALAYWARSAAVLRDALPADDALPVLDRCAHLICNRLGVSAFAEGALRRAAAEAVGSLRAERI